MLMFSRSVRLSPRFGTQTRQFASINQFSNLNPLKPVKHPRKTKIVATIGPSTWHEDGIRSLLSAGINVLRLNCSHGNHTEYAEIIDTLHKCAAEMDDHGGKVLGENANVRCAVAIDTKGPEIRLGEFKAEMKDGVEILAGQEVTFHTNPKVRKEQDEKNLFVDYLSICNCISVGSKVFVDDGLLTFEVVGYEDDDDNYRAVICKALNSAKVSSKKGVNLPDAVLDLPAVSEKDREDLLFARQQKVDFIFASFIRRRSHVEEIRQIVGPDIQIISKIENAEGLIHLDEILDASDGLMVARGDLGIEIPQENVFLAQKLIISKSNLAGKPCIVATQMLDSMTRNMRCSRAEAADVANAVLDGGDALMLSGETANGLYPALTVETMSNICQTAEYAFNYAQATEEIRRATRDIEKPICEALVISAVVAAQEENAQLIIVHSDSGISARIAAKYRPRAQILCVTSEQSVARQLQLSGVSVHAIPRGVTTEEATTMGLRKAHFDEIVKPGDRVVTICAVNSFMKLVEVPEWIGRI